MNKFLALLLLTLPLSAQTINGVTGQSVSGVTSSPAYVAGGGTANAQTATYSPAISSWTAGLQLCWLPIAANTTTTPTFSPNGLAAKTITKNGTAALAASDITTTAIACGTYDGTGLQLQNPQTASGGSGALTLISSQTLGSAAATITFSSIPATYTNLRLDCTARGSQAGADTVNIQFNSDTGAHYDQQSLYQSGAGGPAGGPGAGLTSAQIGSVTGSGAPTGQGGSWDAMIYGYTGTTFTKNLTVSSYRNDTNAAAGLLLQQLAGDWRGASGPQAITAFTLSLGTGGNTFITGSTCSLYGIQ